MPLFARVLKSTKIALINLSLFVGSLLFCLIALELAVRIFGTAPPAEMEDFRFTSSGFYQLDSELGWIPKPLIAGEHYRAGSFATKFHTNSQGLRDREYPQSKPEGKYRILVLGDSFTWGYGVEDNEIYTEILETILPETEVINLGVTGYSLQQEILYFKRKGLEYSPDLVVVGFCLNDIYPEDIDKAMGTSGLKVDDGTGNPLTRKGLFVVFKQAIRRSSAMYRFVVDRLNTNEALVKALVKLGIKDSLAGFESLDVNIMPALRVYPPSLKLSWKETRKELLELQSMLRDLNIGLIIAVIPSVQSVEDKPFRQAISYLTYEAEDFDLDKPYRLLDEFAIEHGLKMVIPIVRFRELTEDGCELYLKRDMHFNPTGHRVFAEAIAEYLSNGAQTNLR